MVIVSFTFQLEDKAELESKREPTFKITGKIVVFFSDSMFLFYVSSLLLLL